MTKVNRNSFQPHIPVPLLGCSSCDPPANISCGFGFMALWCKAESEFVLYVPKRWEVSNIDAQHLKEQWWTDDYLSQHVYAATSRQTNKKKKQETYIPVKSYLSCCSQPLAKSLWSFWFKWCFVVNSTYLEGIKNRGRQTNASSTQNNLCDIIKGWVHS